MDFPVVCSCFLLATGEGNLLCFRGFRRFAAMFSYLVAVIVFNPILIENVDFVVLIVLPFSPLTFECLPPS